MAAKREKIDSKFTLIDTYIPDTDEARIHSHKINTILSDLKSKGRSMEKEVTKNLKNIVNRGITDIDETTEVEVYWADYYEETKIVKIKVILNQAFCINDNELQILYDRLIKTIKVKQLNYGISTGNRPTLMVWM